MRSEKGKRKKVGAFWYSISIHSVLIALLAFPFLKVEKSDAELFEGLLVQFDNQQSFLTKSTQPKREVPQRKVSKKTSNTPYKKAAETNVLKPKLESETKVPKVKPVPNTSNSKSTNDTKKATRKNLETQHTLTEKKRDHLASSVTESELAKKKTELLQQEIQRQAEEEAAKKAKYEKMENAFSQLLKNANHETSSTSPDFNLYDESLDESTEHTTGKDAQSIANRKVIFVPQIKDSSQKEGRVVVKICVDANGKVTSARYTQSGSTTTDMYLIELAVRNARLYRFAPYDIQEQCGRVNIDFEVR